MDTVTAKRDTRVPIRTFELGSIHAEVYEISNVRFIEVSVPGGGRVTFFPHELKAVRLVAELLDREEAKHDPS